MPILTVTVSEDIEVPEGSVVVLAPTGVVSSIRLPDGTEVKPWITYETGADTDEPKDLSFDELTQLGVTSGIDYIRTVEGDIEEIQPETFPPVD